MTTAVTAPARPEGIWSLLTIWQASLPGMSAADFTHEAERTAYEPNSQAGRFMRDAIDTERDRRAGGQP